MKGRREFGIVLALLGVLVVAMDAGSARVSARQTSAEWIAYVRFGDVYALDPASGVKIRLMRGRKAQASWGPYAAGDLAVSPDETRVAFTGATSRGASIFVRPIVGSGRAVDVTPWRGEKVSLSVRALNPQWLNSSHIAYTADVSGSKPFGIVMEVNLATGRFAPMRASKIPGGAEFANINGAHSPAPAQAGVMQPLVVNRRFAAFQRFDYSSGCSATSDLVRGFGTRKKLMTFTPKMDEEPLDLTKDGRVLALRAWISSGRHDGLCTYGGTNTFRQEVIAVARPHRVDVVLRFAPLVLRGNASAPAVDAAWSPDGEHLAYISPHGDLIIRSLRDGSRRVVADHVEALDW
jgi:hypothetical protein